MHTLPSSPPTWRFWRYQSPWFRGDLVAGLTTAVVTLTLLFLAPLIRLLPQASLVAIIGIVALVVVMFRHQARPWCGVGIGREETE